MQKQENDTMTHRSPEQTQSEYSRLMGEEFGHVFYLLTCEVHFLYQKIGDFEGLFGRSHEQINILNEIQGSLFGRYQRVLRNDILLHIARLSDPAQTGKYKNLTMHSLGELSKQTQLSDSLGIMLQQVDSATEFSRSWRNLAIAHKDYEFALDKPAARSVSESTRLAWKSAANQMAETLNYVVQHYKDAEIAFGWGNTNDAHYFGNWVAKHSMKDKNHDHHRR
jgi:hypothetical protein